MTVATVNGRRFSPLVSAPWSIDVTPALKPGANRLEIEVANVPQNAMIDARKAGFKDLKPVPAGFLGPASLHMFDRAAGEAKRR